MNEYWHIRFIEVCEGWAIEATHQGQTIWIFPMHIAAHGATPIAYPAT